MTANYWNKDKRNSSGGKKKRINWNQSLKTKSSEATRPLKIKKSLQYILLLKKFNNVIDYKNVKLLTAFLTKYGKIRPRRKTRITVQQQRSIAKAIRKARAFGLIPFTCDVKI
jgi:ribosomal protein S18